MNGAYRQDQVLHRDLNLDPVLVRKRGPDEVRLSDRVLVGMEDDLCLLVVDVKTTKKKDQPRERRVTRDGLEPVI